MHCHACYIWIHLMQNPQTARAPFEFEVFSTLMREMKHLLDIIAPFLSIQGFLWYILSSLFIFSLSSLTTQQKVFGFAFADASESELAVRRFSGERFREDERPSTSNPAESLGSLSVASPLESAESSGLKSLSFSRTFVSGRCLKWKQLNPFTSMNCEK